jgi:hypothetical protein
MTFVKRPTGGGAEDNEERPHDSLADRAPVEAQLQTA